MKVFYRAPEVNNQNLHSRYYFYACLSIVVGILTQDFFKIPSTLGLIAIGLTWIFSFSFKEKFQALFSQPLAIVMMLFYLLHLISMAYTENTSVGWNDLLLKTSLFLLPLFITSTFFISNHKRFQVLKVFALLMMFMAASDIILSSIRYIETSRSEVFFYVELTHFLPRQPHYVSWYYSFAVFIAAHQVLTNQGKKFWWLAGMVLLLISLVLLSSRIFYIAFVLVFTVSTFKLFNANLLSKSRLRLLILGTSFFLLCILMIPNTSSRIIDAKNEFESFVGVSSKHTNPRAHLWNHGIQLILKKPILGYGVGDARGLLTKSFEGNKSDFFKNNHNFHNQYLQSWAEVGILGVLFLIVLMMMPFLQKNQHPLFLIFLGLTLIGFLTESMLERQAGVIFFAFMYPLLSGFKSEDLK